MEEYYEALGEAYKDLGRSTKAALEGEKKYQNNLRVMEKALAEEDEISMDDEEIEANVKIQVASSPYRRKVDDDIDRLKKVMMDG